MLGDEVFGRWLGSEGGVLMKRINVLVKRSLRTFWWGQSKKIAIYEPVTKKAVTGLCILILDFLPSRVVRNKCGLSNWVYGIFVIAAPTETDMISINGMTLYILRYALLVFLANVFKDLPLPCICTLLHLFLNILYSIMCHSFKYSTTWRNTIFSFLIGYYKLSYSSYHWSLYV